MNKAIAIINPSGLGGAEKRYIALFDYFQKKDENIYLIINEGLLYLAQQKGLICSDKRVLSIPICGDKAKDYNSGSIKNNKEIIGIKKLLGSYISLYKSYIRWLYFKKEVSAVIRVNEISTIYTVWLAGIWLTPLMRKLHLRLIHSFNDSGFSSISPNFVNYFRSEYRILKKADLVDCLSSRLKSGLIDKIKFLDGPKLIVSPCSFIDYSNLFAEEKENIIIFCGRLEKIKNPLLLFQSLNEIKEIIKEMDWKIYIIGTGSLEEEMRFYINEHELECVRMLGYIPDPQKYLRKSKIFISIQQEDNYPSQALMEAMACENAIIASDVGDTRLLIDDNCGKLVRLDVKKLSNSIKVMISNPEVLAQYGRNSRIKVMENHTIKKFATYVKKIME
ncbi:MAG: glycosyltransferase [Saprospiraceae bacterium]|nr:glycosyltransferase [Saprospiraceae bacterium]